MLLQMVSNAVHRLWDSTVTLVSAYGPNAYGCSLFHAAKEAEHAQASCELSLCLTQLPARPVGQAPYSQHIGASAEAVGCCRVTDSLMQHGRNNGKKMMAVRIIKHSFEIVHLLTDQNPIQVLVDAIINRCCHRPNFSVLCMYAGCMFGVLASSTLQLELQFLLCWERSACLTGNMRPLGA